jgi:4-diphosphocytidyl-2-C-methyl-D-erythritol kinase
MIAFPHCKINLGLNVVRKRADGYHDIATCFYPVPLTDVLEVIPSADFSFSSSGNDIPGTVMDNLCVRAFHLMKKEYAIGNVHIHLHKTIPMGAGLGGGSSDGAFTLRLINDVFALGLSSGTLIEQATQLGSDCAFFIRDVPCSGHGRGNDLRDLELDLTGYFLTLVQPPVHVSTASAYAAIVPFVPGMMPEDIVKNQPVDTWKDLLKNDFEETVFRSHPSVKEIKDTFYANGALYSSMSGSGSAVFALFKTSVDLRPLFPPGYFYWSAAL